MAALAKQSLLVRPWNTGPSPNPMKGLLACIYILLNSSVFNVICSQSEVKLSLPAAKAC